MKCLHFTDWCDIQYIATIMMHFEVHLPLGEMNVQLICHASGKSLQNTQGSTC